MTSDGGMQLIRGSVTAFRDFALTNPEFERIAFERVDHGPMAKLLSDRLRKHEKDQER